MDLGLDRWFKKLSGWPAGWFSKGKTGMPAAGKSALTEGGRWSLDSDMDVVDGSVWRDGKASSFPPIQATISLDTRVAALLERASRSMEPRDLARLDKAIILAQRFHLDQRRKTGESFVHHPVRVAQHCMYWGLSDPDALCKAILHDAMEDAPEEMAPRETIAATLGEPVAEGVEALTKFKDIHSGKENLQATYHRLLKVSSTDLSLLIIKAMDVYDNAASYHVHSAKKVKFKCGLALIYVGVARRLGMAAFANSLIERVAPHLMPHPFDRAGSLLEGEQRRAERLGLFDSVSMQVIPVIREFMPSEEELRRAGIEKPFSLERKSASDFFALDRVPGRGTLRSVTPPYYRLVVHVTGGAVAAFSALGQLHGACQPFPRKIRDGLHNPLASGYRALMTRVSVSIGEAGGKEPLSVHFVPVELAGFNRGVVTRLGDLCARRRQFMDLLSNLGDTADLRLSDFQEVVRPDGLEVVDGHTGKAFGFPPGAIILDYAFRVAKPKLAIRCLGAVIDGMKRPPEYPLTDGSSVKIMTSGEINQELLGVDWLRRLETPRAKKELRRVLRERRVPVDGIGVSPEGGLQVENLAAQELTWCPDCLPIPEEEIWGDEIEQGAWRIHRKGCPLPPVEGGVEKGLLWGDHVSTGFLEVDFSLAHRHGSLLQVMALVGERHRINGMWIESLPSGPGAYAFRMVWGGLLPAALGRALKEMEGLESVLSIDRYAWLEKAPKHSIQMEEAAASSSGAP